MSIKQVGTYFKGKKLENGAEMIEKYDNFFIEIENATVNAIAKIDKEGYYFNILAVYRNGRIYRGQRYHIKYMTTVRDIIFEYYKENNLVLWSDE